MSRTGRWRSFLPPRCLGRVLLFLVLVSAGGWGWRYWNYQHRTCGDVPLEVDLGAAPRGGRLLVPERVGPGPQAPRQTPESRGAAAPTDGFAAAAGLESDSVEALARLAATDPYEALRMNEGMPGEWRREGLRRIFRAWAAVDSEAALAAAHVRVEAERFDALRGTLDTWLESRPEAALAWLNAYPESALREALLIEALPHWAAFAPQEAAGFVGALEPADTRTRAAPLLVSAWATRDPESAFRWAASLPDQESRSAAQVAVLGVLLPADSSTARRLIQSLARVEDRSALEEWLP